MDCRIGLKNGCCVSVDATLLATTVAHAESFTSVAALLEDLETTFCLDGRMLVVVLDLFQQDTGSTASTFPQLMNWLGVRVESWRVSLGQKMLACEFLLASPALKKIRFGKRPSHKKVFRQVSKAAFPELKRSNANRTLTKLATGSFWRSISFRLQSADSKTTSIRVVRRIAHSMTVATPETEPAAPKSAPVESIPCGLTNLDDNLQTMKLRSMRWLAYGASHEINNPLANITIRAETLARTENDPERRKKLLAIQQQALRAHQMISDLMLIAQPPKTELRPTTLKAVIEQVLGEFNDRLVAAHITVRLDLEDCPVVALDGKQIAEMIKALLQNSIHSTGPNGLIRIQTRSDTNGQSLSIEDNGVGIANEILPSIFDPFFSGREAGRGLGFGLTKAWRIAEDHGGKLTCVSAKAGATRFQFELPVAQTVAVVDSRAA